MPHVTRFAVAAFALVAPALLGARQQPTTPPPGTGVIVGQLVDGGTGKPVASALITLITPRPIVPENVSAAPPPVPQLPVQPPRALSDSNGRFMFSALAPGSYQIAASHVGYLAANFGQTQPLGGSRSVTIADTPRVNTVTMKIWKQASITGRVLDEAGEPAVNVMLRLVRRAGSGGSARYSVYGLESTDDRGMYRFGQLSPGDYFVVIPGTVMTTPLATVDAYMNIISAAATPAAAIDNPIRTAVSASGGALVTSGMRIGDQYVAGITGRGGSGPPPIVHTGGRNSVYPTTFYSGAPNLEGATLVTVGSGDDRTGVDLSLKLVPATQISGTVTGPDGPAPNLAVKITAPGLEKLSNSTTGFDTATAITRADGTFTAVGVPPGQYVVYVLKVPRSLETQTALLHEPVLWARVPVSVPPSGLEGVAISLAIGPTVSGRVEFESGATPVPARDVLQRANVSLTSLEYSALRIQPTMLAADGSFTMRGYSPGRYSLSMYLPAPGWTIKSVMLGGKNVVNRAIDLSTSDLTVTVTFTDQSSEISGSVVRKNATDADAFAVMLIPADYQALVRDGSIGAAVKSTPVGPNGSFVMSGILAGDYLIVAMEGRPNPDDPEGIAALARQGTKITIGDHEKRSMSLTVVKGGRP